jgi:hypothetical protein
MFGNYATILMMRIGRALTCVLDSESTTLTLTRLASNEYFISFPTLRYCAIGKLLHIGMGIS